MDKQQAADEALPFRQSLAMFVRRRSLRMVMVGSGLAAFVSYGMLNWIPAFLMRTQGMPLDAMATWLATAVLIPSFAAALLVDSWQVSLALMLIPMAACTAYVAPALALVQNLTPPRSRATAAAVLMLMFNIVGLGLGPLFIGVVSDHLKPAYGDESLRWALLTILPFAVAAGLAQFAMTRHLDQDFAE